MYEISILYNRMHQYFIENLLEVIEVLEPRGGVCIPVISAVRRLRKEGFLSLGCTVRYCLNKF